jgi:hypothetical protein
MAITNGYTTLAAVRYHLGFTNASDTSADTYIEAVVEAASREIDEYCNRRFYVSTSDEERYFTAMDHDICFTDDIQSITSIEIDDDDDRTYAVELASTDYDAYPINYALSGSPILWLETAPNADYNFPKVAKGIKITGKFGYCAIANVPRQVSEACIIQAVRLFKRGKEAPFGVVGASDMGQSIVISKLDPDVEMLLKPFVRIGVTV